MNPHASAVAVARVAIRRPARRRHGRARGVMLLALMLALAIGSVAVLAVSDVWAVTRQRELEEELLFVGDQYRLAIERYYHAQPQAKQLPRSLDELLADPRFPTPVRHLRRLYADPITGTTDWGLVKSGDRIAGVFSRSQRSTVKRALFPEKYLEFEGREVYAQWRFVFAPATLRPGARPERPAPGASPGG